MTTEDKLKRLEKLRAEAQRLEDELFIEAPLEMLKPAVYLRLRELVSSNRRDFKIGMSSGVTRPMVYQMCRSHLCTRISHDEYELTDRAYEVLGMLPPEQVIQGDVVAESVCEHDFGDYESLNCLKCGVPLF